MLFLEQILSKKVNGMIDGNENIATIYVYILFLYISALSVRVQVLVTRTLENAH
jgi:hypothetical protein